MIVVGRALHTGHFDELIATVIHELCHVLDNEKCDQRDNHDQIFRWEFRLYRSRALREAIAIRLGNAILFNREEA